MIGTNEMLELHEGHFSKQEVDVKSLFRSLGKYLNSVSKNASLPEFAKLGNPS